MTKVSRYYITQVCANSGYRNSKLKIMETHLEEDYDNKRVKKDEFGKFSSSELIKSIESRIVQHRELIKRDEGLIYDGVDCVEVVTSSIERIKERNAKIGELRELIEDCL